MKTLLIALLLGLSTPAYAACVWTAPTTFGAQGACDTTPVAPTVNDGLQLEAQVFGPSSVKAIAVVVETAGTMTAGGVLQAYVKNPISGTWVRVADGSLDLVVSAVASQAFTAIYVPVPRGRIAYVASGVGVACTIYLNPAY
jgi:hypothetical protein